MFYDTKDTINSILDGIPEEGAWIEYKSACDFSREFKKNIQFEVTAFLNSLQYFGKDKFILFGIHEDKETKKKELTGLGEHCFPDDNEWQNLFSKIKPMHPTVETGTYSYQGHLFGYLYISADNYNGPYFCSDKKGNGKVYWIRRGGNKCPDMTDDELKLLERLSKETWKKGRTFQKTKEALVVTTIGQYEDRNENDRNLIEQNTGETFEKFRRHCLIQDSSMIRREDSVYGASRSTVSRVDSKDDRLLQFSPDDAAAAVEIARNILEHRDIVYSDDLLDGILDTLAFLSNNGFSHIVQEMIRSSVTADIFQDSRYRTRIGYLAEADPDFMLTLIQNDMAAFCQIRCKNTAVIQALKTIAWYPKHYEQAVQLLWALDEKDALYGLLHWASIATAANFQQKLRMVREIAGWNRKLIFDMLNRILYYNPKTPTVFNMMEGRAPSMYRRFLEGTHSEDIAKLQTYYRELLNTCGDNAEDILTLLPLWLQPFPFSNLYWLADRIEEIEPKITDPNDREKLWNRLCNTPLVYITDQDVVGGPRARLLAVGQRFKPADPDAVYRQWFRENIEQDIRIGEHDGGDDAVYERIILKIKSEQKAAILELYSQGGMSRVTKFLAAVSVNPHFLAELLTSDEFVLTEEDNKGLLAAYFDAPEKYANYFYMKCSAEGLRWLKEIGIKTLEPAKKARLFAALEPNEEMLQSFEEYLGADAGLYWRLVKPIMLTKCLKSAFEQFLKYGLPEKAFELFRYPFRLEELSPQWLSQSLISMRKYQGIHIPEDVFSRIYHALTGHIDDSVLAEIEELSFKQYGDQLFAYGAQALKPRVTFRRIANEPRVFMECVKNANGLLSFEEKLLRQCDAAPDHPQDWLSEIEALCVSEPESVRGKAETWTGYILYNELKEDGNGGYTLDALVAEALERSERRREGFLHHAHDASLIAQSYGSSEGNVGDRERAKRFEALAAAQRESGNMKFAECIQSYAEQLIAMVESAQ